MSGERQDLCYSFPSSVASELSPTSSLSLSASASFDILKESLVRSSVGLDLALTQPHRDVVSSAFTEHPRKDEEQCCTMTSSRNTDLAFSPEAGSLDRAGEDEWSEAYAFHSEDLECLQSLLDSSDEEKSSGTVFSGLVCDTDPPGTPISAPVSGSKRSSEGLDGDEVEVESRLHKRHRPELEGFSSDTSVIGDVSDESLPISDEGICEETCIDYCGSDEIQMLCDELGYGILEEHCSSCIQDGDEDLLSSGSARESRRQKIKETVRLLRDVIPGGDCLDTAIVLDEAINYVKLLQLQVQTLGAERLAQLPL